jgi:hypothetical protein
MTDFLDLRPYGLSQPEKDELLTRELGRLTRHHRAACPEYARILAALGCTADAFGRVEDVPFLPVSLFKSHRLASVPVAEIVKTLTSSGTSGQAPSRVFLDRTTAQAQARALARIMAATIGSERLPMVLVDSAALLRDRSTTNARAAGVLGMMPLGRDHVFALDENLRLDEAALARFIERFRGRRILLFGFTFVVWRHFAAALAAAGLRFDDAVLIHSGGWKKLAEEAVDNATFKARVAELTGIRRIHNFYGMAEQVGSVFVEGEDGLLYPPAFADAIIRDPLTLAPLPNGETGIVQVLSLLPTSYPGHSLLTEDLGRIAHVDAALPERGGKGIEILGRLPRAELRGCSDVNAARSAA